MITNSEEANKYYQLINQYIDDYTEKWKIKPSNLGKYLLKNNKLIKFLERNGLKDIKNVDRVIKDVIDDRIAIQNDMVMTFENFKFFESTEFKMLDLRQCLYKGVDKTTIEHEKILADHFDISLSHINIINADKHILKIEGLKSDFECVIYTIDELGIIKENIKEYCLEQATNTSIILQGVGLKTEVNIREFIDVDKFKHHIDSLINMEKVKEILRMLLSCDRIEDVGEHTRKALVGINPGHY